MNQRFSKRALGDYIALRLTDVAYLNFDRGNGYAQVRGKGEEANRAYGEWNALLTLAEQFDITVELITESA